MSWFKKKDKKDSEKKEEEKPEKVGKTYGDPVVDICFD